MASHENPSTQVWKDRTETTESIADLKKLLTNVRLNTCGWTSFFENELTSRGIKIVKMASLCSVTRQTVSRWKGKNEDNPQTDKKDAKKKQDHMPQSREQFIKIAMAFGMNIEQTNHILQRYGLYPKLYARNISDAVRIYAINNRLKGTEEAKKYDNYPYQYVLDLDAKLKAIMERRIDPKTSGAYIETQKITDDIAEISDDRAFEAYINEHRNDFPDGPYQKLTGMIHSYIGIQDSGHATVNSLVESGFFDAEFNSALSTLKNHGEVPTREKLITVGIRFNMTVEMLNKLLELAGAEPLCAHIPEEMALIFAIRNAHIYNPYFEYDLALRLSKTAKDKNTQKFAQKLVNEYEKAWGTSEPKTLSHDSVEQFVRHVLVKLGEELPGVADKYCPVTQKP